MSMLLCPLLTLSLSTAPPAATTGLFENNDPFGAAPATNIEKTENNNDLFAKAPKPFGSDKNSTINTLTQEIFENMRSSPLG